MKAKVLFEDHYAVSPARERVGSALRLPIGVNERGTLEEIEISGTTWQHILVAGGTCSGKSNYLHSVLGSLLLSYTPEQVNIWLSDGGTYEFSLFADHTPGHIKRVNTGDSCAELVDDLVEEIEKRFTLITRAGFPTFDHYCRKTGTCPFPRLVVLMDDFDLFVRELCQADRIHMEKLENRIRYAAACGITLVISIQDAASLLQNISRGFFSLLGIRLVVDPSPSSCALLLGARAVEPARSLTLGEAIVNIPDFHKVDLLYLSTGVKEKILKAVINHF